MKKLCTAVPGLCGIVLAGTLSAGTQVPPHQPGTVCFIPSGWCWAPRVGPPGSPCQCPAAGVPVAGRLG